MTSHVHMLATPMLEDGLSKMMQSLGKQSDLLTPHDEYLKLSKNVAERQRNYRHLFKCQLDKELVTKINDATNKGLAIGSENFKQEIEMNFKRRMTPSKMGRPKKVMV